MRFAAIVHSQANGKVEAINKIINSILKKHLEKVGGKSIDKFLLALWAYKATHKSAIGHTPFALTYDSEAVIPMKLEFPSHRVTYYDPKTNKDLLMESLDMVDEKKEEVDMRAAAHQHQVVRYYNIKIQPRTFKVGDLVLKSVFPVPVRMGLKWEGPYSII